MRRWRESQYVMEEVWCSKKAEWEAGKEGKEGKEKRTWLLQVSHQLCLFPNLRILCLDKHLHRRKLPLLLQFLLVQPQLFLVLFQC